ncbi:hypothetical protein AB0O20_27745 [Streptomyces kronopolitis]|uniref:hypothetical protein n=1 Tax=Streptomyces kronopolitis TaxID=1612435 RepID=UPI003416F3FA
MTIWYATREDVTRALDVRGTARNSAQIDRQIEAASRAVEALCHRRGFAPAAETRYFDWPGTPGTRPWRLWLDDSDLIEVSGLASGGVVIPSDSYFLEPQAGPPYTRIELNLAGNSAFGGGPTPQRAIAVTGVWGYSAAETPTGATTAALDAAGTTVTVDGPASAALGVGSVIRLGGERMAVTGRRQHDTGQALGGPLAAKAAEGSIAVADSAGFEVDEAILVDAERMLIVDIAGNTLIVKRGWDGSTLASHDAGATVYAPRSLTVARGVLGTTAAGHDAGAGVQRWDPPGPVRQLVIAEAMSALTSEVSGYARAVRSGEGSAERGRDMGALQMQRDATYDACGRRARVRAV